MSREEMYSLEIYYVSGKVGKINIDSRTYYRITIAITENLSFIWLDDEEVINLKNVESLNFKELG